MYQTLDVSEIWKVCTAPMVESFLTFRENAVVMNISVVQYETVRLPAVPGINHPTTRCHTPQERRRQLHRCESLEIYSQSTTNKMQCFSFNSVRRSTCFRRFSRPSSGAQNCTQRQVFVRPLLLRAARQARLAARSSIGLTNT